MKKMFLFILLLCTVHAFAQTAQQEINEQVWKPFVSTFNTRDTQGFMAVHSKDVVRAPRDSKAVWNWSEYFKQQEAGDKRGKAANARHQLELRFTERIASTDQALEVGVYKTTVTRADGITQSFYGRFHVALRKESGTWKILVDTDSSENGSITEKDFLAASPME